MVALNAPSSTAVVDVPEAYVDAYVSQGWTRNDSADESESKRRPGRPKKSE